MKRLHCFLFLLLSMAVACNKEVILNNEKEDTEVYTLKLNLLGDVTTSESPLTKGEESDCLFGIWIGEDGEAIENYFAAGLFDEYNDISIYLHAGHKYYIKSTLIKNGKQVVQKRYSGGYLQGYLNPFGYKYYESYGNASFNYGYYPTNVKNRIGYKDNNDNYAQHMYDSNTLTYKKTYNGPTTTITASCSLDNHISNNADRYYGEISNLTPTQNGTIDLELKHTVVGVKYIIAGLTDGSIALTVKRGEDDFISEPEITSNCTSDGAVFECTDVHGAWQYPSTYKETATVSVEWTRGIGITQNLGSVDVDLLRNRMNVININLAAETGDVGFGVNVEDTEMGNESVTINVG